MHHGTYATTRACCRDFYHVPRELEAGFMLQLRYNYHYYGVVFSLCPIVEFLPPPRNMTEDQSAR